MKSLLSIFLLILTVCFANAQQKPVLSLERGNVKHEGSAINMKQALALMENYPEALAYMKKAKSNMGAAQVLGFIGGGLIGYPIGTAIGGGEANWTLAAIGGATILAALPLSAAFKKNANLAIDLYNKADYRALNHDIRLNIGLNDRGFGLRISF